MNQETRMHDAEAVSREVRLNIAGTQSGGEISRYEPGTLLIVSDLVPLAVLTYDSTPDKSMLLTARDFWAGSRPVGQVWEPQHSDHLTGHWIPLEMQAGQAAVALQPSLVLVLEDQGQACWYHAGEAPGDGVPAPGLIRLTMDEGLLGLAEWKDYLCFHAVAEDPVGLLIPLAAQSVSMTVVDPFQVLPDYQPAVSVKELQALGAAEQHELAWLSILNIQNDPFSVYANLLGPIVYNPETGSGKQVVLSNSGYSASHPLGQAAVLEGGR